MRTICSMAAGIGVAAAVFAAPAALAEPGAPGYVAVQCQVWAQSPMAFAPGGAFGPGGMGMGMKQWAGTVIGRGPDEGAARADAERQMWDPTGPCRSFVIVFRQRAERNKIKFVGSVTATH